jgi:signal transduction histidine kinase
VTGLERESARIDRIIRGLLDYARAKSRTPADVDLNDVARGVVDLLNTQGVLKRIELELRVADDPLLVPGDRHDFEQAFVNLLLNAVDAMEGRGSLSIILRRTDPAELTLGARRASDAESRPLNPPGARAMRWLENVGADSIAAVVITDSGPGIPAEDAERVFEPFFTTKQPGRGTGLGLSICYGIVEDHRGRIEVDSAPGRGSTFRMYLPAAG